MRAARYALAAAAILIGLLPTISFSGSPYVPPAPIVADHPFDSETAIINLSKVVPVGAALNDALQLVNSVGYDFVIENPCSIPKMCDLPKETYIRESRHTVLSLKEVDAKIAEQMQANEEHTCEKSVRTYDLHKLYVTDERIAYQFGWSGTKYKCGHVLGVAYKVELGSARGNVVIALDLKETPSVDYAGPDDRGSVTFDIPQPIVTTDHTGFLGINLGTFVGGLLKFVLGLSDDLFQFVTFDKADLGFNKLLEKLNNLNVSVAEAYAYVAENEKRLTAVKTAFGKLEDCFLAAEVFYLDADATRFVSGPGETTLDLVYFSLVNEARFRNFAYPSRLWEIDTLNSLNQTGQDYTVQAGDSLYDIAKRFYRTGEFYLYLAAINNFKRMGQRLHPGDVIRVPAIWEVSVGSGRITRPGDTLWSRFLRNHPASEWNIKNLEVPFGSPNVNRIYPLQVMDEASQPLCE